MSYRYAILRKGVAAVNARWGVSMGRAEPEPVDGVVVPGSRMAPLVGVIIGPVASGLAIMALGIWWTTGVGAPGAGILACAAGAFLGLGVMAWSVRELCAPMR